MESSEMKTYPEYKDSGVDWIGKIPKDWNVIKLKFILNSLESGNREKDSIEIEDGVYSIGGEHINWSANIDLSKPRLISKEYYDKLRNGKIKLNDVLLVKDGATIGKCTIIKKELDKPSAVNEHVFILRAKHGFNSNFLFYSIFSNIGQEQIKLCIRGSAQPGLNSSFVNSTFLLSPPLREQNEIVEFLNKKTSKINKLVKKKQQLIELLKEQRIAIINHAVTKGLDESVELKDSGIEWIGKIPDNWNTKKLKYVSDLLFSNVDKKVKKSEIQVRSCNYVDVYKNEFIDQNTPFLNISANGNEIEKFSIKKGDVLVTKDSETAQDIAVPAYVSTELPKILCGYHLAMVRGNKDLLGEYIFRVFQSKDFNVYFEASAKGVTRYGLSMEAFKNAIIPIPPMSVQRGIVKFINEQTSQIDKSIKKIQKEIELLQEYKEILISEAVTGKMKVVR